VKRIWARRTARVLKGIQPVSAASAGKSTTLSGRIRQMSIRMETGILAGQWKGCNAIKEVPSDAY